MASLLRTATRPLATPVIAAMAGRAFTGGVPGTTAHQVLEKHVRWARIEGLTAGVLTTVAQATSIVGTAGTLTLPMSLLGLGLDTLALRVIQAQMVTGIAVLHGRTADDAGRIYDDLTSLYRTDAEHEDQRGGVSAAGGRLVAERVRSLPGTVAKAVGKRALLMVGAGWVFRVLPVVNIPFTGRNNAQATRDLGEKALVYYQ